ncbi:MAG: ABC transporter permease [Alphaproteobacteria bacterium]|nr:ABC transporter permease [Alphaproteobacteria bacterium]
MSIAFFCTKVLRALLTALLAVTFVFVMLRLSGDLTLEILGDQATPEMEAYLEEHLGLDRPIWEQYLGYVGGVLNGDFGQSFRDDRDVVEIVSAAVPKTLLLGGLSFLAALLIGIPAGVTAAIARDTIWDRFVIGFAVVGHSLPNFFFGIMLILLFTLNWRLLPSAGSTTPAHLIMPVITIGTSWAGVLARFSRSSMLEVLSKPYIRASRARGFDRFRTVWREALPNAAIPTVTVCGLMVGGLISGAVVTETVFAWPGIGRMLVTSVIARDVPVVQFIVLIVTFSMVFTNLAVDLLYGFLDPRIGSARLSADGKD